MFLPYTHSRKLSLLFREWFPNLQLLFFFFFKSHIVCKSPFESLMKDINSVPGMKKNHTNAILKQYLSPLELPEKHLDPWWELQVHLFVVVSLWIFLKLVKLIRSLAFPGGFSTQSKLGQVLWDFTFTTQHDYSRDHSISILLHNSMFYFSAQGITMGFQVLTMQRHWLVFIHDTHLSNSCRLSMLSAMYFHPTFHFRPPLLKSTVHRQNSKSCWIYGIPDFASLQARILQVPSIQSRNINKKKIASYGNSIEVLITH